jgi:hypothetical protein
VYEIVPIFGDCFTIEEMHYWWIYNTIQSAKTLGIKYEEYGFEELLTCIKRKKEEMERKRKK